MVRKLVPKTRLYRGLFDIEVLSTLPSTNASSVTRKALYAKAKTGRIKNYTGDAPYEAPEAAEIHLLTSGQDRSNWSSGW